MPPLRRAAAVLLAACFLVACDAKPSFRGRSAPIVGRPRIPPGVPEEFLHFDDADVGRGDLAPDFALTTVEGDRTIRLSELRGRPTVLVFGSRTCVLLRRHIEELRDLYRETAAHLNFVFVYVREAHAEDEWTLPFNQNMGLRVPQPRTSAAREAQAAACAMDLRLEMPVVVDDLDDTVSRVYGGFPIRLYVIDAEGRVAYQGDVGPFGFKPDTVRRFIFLRWGF